jgi:hypothetical protein
MRISAEGLVGSNMPMGLDTNISKFLGIKNSVGAAPRGVETVKLLCFAEMRLLEALGVGSRGLEVDLKVGVVGVALAVDGTGFLLTGEFFVTEKVRSRPVALKTGTLMPSAGFSRR